MMDEKALKKWQEDELSTVVGNLDEAIAIIHEDLQDPCRGLRALCKHVSAAAWREADKQAVKRTRKQAVKRTLEHVASQLHIRANLEPHPITKPCKDTAALLYKLADDIRQMKP